MSTILSDYAFTMGAQEPLTGALSMTVDNRYRLQLREHPDGRILIRTRLRGLPPRGPARDQLMDQSARLACARMLSAPVFCAIDAEERGLWLQQLCDAPTVQHLDEQVGAFVNELSLWVKAIHR